MNSDFNTVESCGLVVFGGNSVLLIKRENKWDLPKGKKEAGETYRQTALRETDEETGIPQHDLEIVRDLFPTQHFTIYSGDHYIKTTHWFLAKYRGPNDHVLIPETDEDIEEVKWVSIGIIGQYLPEMRGYARYVMELTLEMLYIEQQSLKDKLRWGDC